MISICSSTCGIKGSIQIGKEYFVGTPYCAHFHPNTGAKAKSKPLCTTIQIKSGPPKKISPKKLHRFCIVQFYCIISESQAHLSCLTFDTILPQNCVALTLVEYKCVHCAGQVFCSITLIQGIIDVLRQENWSYQVSYLPMNGRNGTPWIVWEFSWIGFVIINNLCSK